MELIKFKELESKLKNLIEEYSSLKKRNLEVETLLKNKVTELGEAHHQIRGLKEERDAVRTKVDSLLDLLQDISVPK